MNSRQQTILQMVIDQGQVSVTDLAKATGVSEVTIRQDLNTLEVAESTPDIPKAPWEI